jgi:SHS2 domain-containing protein
VHRWIEHTAEVELEVDASSAEEVFAEAALALGELIATEETSAGARAARREVSIAAPDLAALLADWLQELVFLADTEGLVPERVAHLALGEDREGHSLVAAVEGVTDAARPLVKAVTYHRLELNEKDGSWRARVTFDV